MSDLCGAGTSVRVEEAVTFAAVTASLNLGDRDRTGVTGFDGYIQKPIDHETFVGKIE
jgi:CheY-like chemotaxis protein